MFPRETRKHVYLRWGIELLWFRRGDVAVRRLEAQATVLGRDAIILLEVRRTMASPSISPVVTPGNSLCGKAPQGFAPVKEPVSLLDTMVLGQTMRK